MTPYRKFSDSFAEDAPQTLATLATLAGGTPSIPKEEPPPKPSFHSFPKKGGPQKQTPTPAKVAKVAKVTESAPAIYAKALAELESGCPNLVEPERCRAAVEDGRRFLAEWGEQAERLGWTAHDLFGLHEVPANPDARYRRLSRYDCTGLIWLLQGQLVVALTDSTAAIQSKTGAITTYRKRNNPALPDNTLGNFVG
jgi:hypothetical protein